MAETTYLICDVSEGMFPTEKYVTVLHTDNYVIDSGFFPNYLIKGNKLLVHVYSADGYTALVGTGSGHVFLKNQSQMIVVPKSLIVTEE